MLPLRNNNKSKTITFRFDEHLILEFRDLCKKHDYKQASIIKRAIKKAIKELKELDNES